MAITRMTSIGAAALALVLAATGATVAQGEGPAEAAADLEDLPPYAAIEGELIFLGSVIGEFVTSPEPPMEIWRDWRATGRLVTNDPRLNADGMLNQTYMGFEPGGSGGSVRTGIGRFENDGGAWSYESIGFNYPGVSITNGTHLAWAMTGEGGYEGLSAILFVLPGGGFHDWEVRGVIAPAPLPGLPASVEAPAE